MEWTSPEQIRRALRIGPDEGDAANLAAAAAVANEKAQKWRADIADAKPDKIPASILEGTTLLGVLTYQAGTAPSGFSGYDEFGGSIAPTYDRSAMARIYLLLGVNRPETRIG